MERLVDMPDDSKFYRGTIIILKNMHNSPAGKYDIIYCMIGQFGGLVFDIIDLYKSIGGVICHNLKPNIEGHVAVNKQGIKNWVKEHFELFYQKEWVDENINNDFLDSIIYISNLDEYFTQANRDLFISKPE